MSILFINACVRENSRTLVLAAKVMEDIKGEICEIDLGREDIASLNRELLEKRDSLLRTGALDHPMLKYAKQFANADQIVIAAPFWDLSFPSLLKTYLENITVAGITFEYHDGRPIGLCRAKKLTYVTTAGGEITDDFGYSYVKALATKFYGIEETVSVRAENLDVYCISGEDLFKDAKITTVR